MGRQGRVATQSSGQPLLNYAHSQHQRPLNFYDTTTSLISNHTHTHTHTPVSYTHLDVYKRQVLAQWKQLNVWRSYFSFENDSITSPFFGVVLVLKTDLFITSSR